MLRFIVSLFIIFVPYFFTYIERIIYCYIKKKNKDSYSCYYWNCPKFLYCKYNQKTLLDFKKSYPKFPYYIVIPSIIIQTILLYIIVIGVDKWL